MREWQKKSVRKTAALEKEQQRSKIHTTRASCKIGKRKTLCNASYWQSQNSTLSNYHHSEGQKGMVLKDTPATLLQVMFLKQMSVMSMFVHL